VPQPITNKKTGAMLPFLFSNYSDKGLTN